MVPDAETDDWYEDREALAEQYADSSNLDARKALHERYSTADDDLFGWLFDRLDVPDDARILTLGGGPGSLWRPNAGRVPPGWTPLVTDASSGMVREARGELRDAPGDHRFATVDAATLPFATDSVDAATAHFMLYHVPDRRRLFREVRRVLRPGGALHAATSGPEHLRELRAVVAEFADGDPGRPDGFDLANGREQLAPVFETVELDRYDDALRVTAVEPLVRYALSREDIDDDQAPALHEAFAERFDDGAFHVTKEVGVFRASVAEHGPTGGDGA